MKLETFALAILITLMVFVTLATLYSLVKENSKVYDKLGLPVVIGTLITVAVICTVGISQICAKKGADIGHFYEIERTQSNAPDVLAYMDEAYVTNANGEIIKATVKTDPESDTNYYVKERFEMFGLYLDEDYLVIGTKDGIDDNVDAAQLAFFMVKK